MILGVPEGALVQAALGAYLVPLLAMILAVGMSWSHLSRRMTGQLDTDAVE
mgnify:CR=1 FL=1